MSVTLICPRITYLVENNKYWAKDNEVSPGATTKKKKKKKIEDDQ